MPPTNPEYDYIVVGSGAGGGPVAANLAKAGFKVCLIEAGTSDEPDCYSVPVFHPFASEHPDLSWDFFVRHYASDELSKRDGKFDAAENGVFYPRAGTLGGCTAHHAMITVYGHNSDWEFIQKLTGDDSWAPDKMRGYFERLERCGYVPKVPQGEPNPTRHGFDGWLDTTGPDLKLVFGDLALLQTVLDAVTTTWKQRVGDSVLPQFIPSDPNDWQTPSYEGICFAPMATRDGRRVGTRELINSTRTALPDRLIVKGSNLATKILFDENKRAIGVETHEGQNLYKASPKTPTTPPQEGKDFVVKQYFCSREVILSGGAFNSPQLLMLSGIGPKAHLEQHGIPCLVDRPGVGTNLQDRYEVGVVTEMKEDWKILEGATFKPPLPNESGDPCYADWREGKGVYTTNGSVLGIIKKSTPDRPDPDLFIFALPGNFHGYFRGYSEQVERTKNYLTWAVLKAHTDNTGGTVRLKSADPRERPEINFHYFTEGTDKANSDLKAVVEGVQFVRDISKNNSAIKQEVIPGGEVGDRNQIAQFVMDNAWGHHASCSNPMGTQDNPNAVVDAHFRVFGTQGLRVVDASVFPRIPGFFLVTPTYMIAEKASDVIIADAKAGT